MGFAIAPSDPQRPNIMARRHGVASGHYLASLAGFQVLEAGGNAIDAGVATGIALNVLESEMCSFGGVAPTMLYLAERNEVLSFSGVGPWPRRATCEYFVREHAGMIPKGILYSVVPAAADIWLSALERYGTMEFGEVAQAAIRFARDGFPMYPMLRQQILERVEGMEGMPTTQAVYLPGGKVPELGETFFQRDMGSMLQYLADEERAHRTQGRAAGIDAARRAFYRGDVARAIVRQQEEMGGLVTAEDLAAFRAGIETPEQVRFGDFIVYGCGAWSQGPMVLETLNLLKGFDLAAMGHNSPDYLHTLVEAVKLAAADRERYFGDPKFVEVPLNVLLSDAYAETRRRALDPNRAAPEMPMHGEVPGYARKPWKPDPSARSAGPIPQVHIHSADQHLAPQLETTYLCAMDRHGNAFSSTPSDANFSSHIVPGLGIVCSTWGSRAYTDPEHPAAIGPGRRPKMSANPQIAISPGRKIVAYGSPGNEVLGLAQLQVFLNLAVFGMDPQSAVEQARVASYSWPGSIVPHPYFPARLNVEARIPRATGDALAARGHKVEWWPERKWLAGSPCVIAHDLELDVRFAAADHRRTAYAIGW